MLHIDARVRRGEFELAVQLDVARGEIVAVMGPNGSGKSTLLEAIAGLLAMEGRIEVDGRELTGENTVVAPAARSVGLLGQDPVLFPHLTALDNVAFGPRTVMSRRHAEERARVELAEVGLSEFSRRRPRALSGGQQQRVALARALAADPAVLLLDEPMAAIDSDSVPRMRELVRSRAAGRATIIVTHDARDALELADRVILLDEGRIVREGSPRHVLSTLSAGVSVDARVDDEGRVLLPAGIRLEPGQKLTVTLGSNHGDTDAAVDPG